MPADLHLGPFPLVGVVTPTWVVRFDQGGQCISPATARALIAHLASGNYSDILFHSHGWNTDFSAAIGQYADFLRAFEQVLARHPLDNFRPIFVGTAWPSVWFAEDQGPTMAGLATDIQDQIVTAIAQPLSPVKRERLYELSNAASLNFDGARELASLLLPSVAGTPDEVDDAVSLTIDSDALVAAAVLLGTVAQSSRRGTGGGLDGSAVLPEAQVLRGEGGINPADILRMFSLFQMKDRAGAVGATGVATLLRQIQTSTPARLHALGHSFGCKVMLSALCAPATLPRPIDSALLMQPAISHLAMAEMVPGRRGPGGYRTALDRVSGRIFSTFSAKDQPLHDVFHFALRRSADIGEVASAAAAGEPPNKYAAMGGYGPRGSGERLLTPIPAPGENFGDLGTSKLVGLDGSSDRINGHGDVATGFTAWALRHLIEEGSRRGA